MILLPFENIIYKTHLKKAEISRRLNNLIEPEQELRWGNKASKKYEGEFSPHSFSIMRILRRRNRFAPVIKGTLLEGTDAISVNISMRPTIFIIIFMFFWFSLLGFACVLFSLSSIMKHYPLNPLPFLMFGFSYALFIILFKYESVKAQKDLQDLFEIESDRASDK